MGAVQIELMRAVDQIFPGAKLQVVTNATGRVCGFVISDLFDGQPHLVRQNHLWDGLERLMPTESFRSLSALLTMTPEEIAEDVLL